MYHQFPLLLSGLVLAGLGFVTGSPVFAEKACFLVADPLGRDVVKFTSDAPLELVSGQTSRIKGSACLDPSLELNSRHPAEVRFEVNLASLTTGIELRDRHLRELYLETDKYPVAEYKVRAIQTKVKPPYKNSQAFQLISTGDFSLHGVTLPLTVPLTVTYLPESDLTHSRFPAGDVIRIQGTFPIKLSDFHIRRPEMFSQKLAETVYITIDVFGNSSKNISKIGSSRG